MESVKILHRFYITYFPLSITEHKSLIHSGRIFPLHVNLQQGLQLSDFMRTTQLSV